MPAVSVPASMYTTLSAGSGPGAWIRWRLSENNAMSATAAMPRKDNMPLAVATMGRCLRGVGGGGGAASGCNASPGLCKERRMPKKPVRGGVRPSRGAGAPSLLFGLSTIRVLVFACPNMRDELNLFVPPTPRRLREAWRDQWSTLRKTSEAFVPPKPNEFDRATSTRRLRAT